MGSRIASPQDLTVLDQLELTVRAGERVALRKFGFGQDHAVKPVGQPEPPEQWQRRDWR